MNEFLLGALAVGFFVGAMFFARFFVRTRDRFFAFVSTAFVIMSANQVASPCPERPPSIAPGRTWWAWPRSC